MCNDVHPLHRQYHQTYYIKVTINPQFEIELKIPFLLHIYEMNFNFQLFVCIKSVYEMSHSSQLHTESRHSQKYMKLI